MSGRTDYFLGLSRRLDVEASYTSRDKAGCSRIEPSGSIGGLMHTCAVSREAENQRIVKVASAPES